MKDNISNRKQKHKLFFLLSIMNAVNTGSIPYFSSPLWNFVDVCSGIWCAFWETLQRTEIAGNMSRKLLWYRINTRIIVQCCGSIYIEIGSGVILTFEYLSEWIKFGSGSTTLLILGYSAGDSGWTESLWRSSASCWTPTVIILVCSVGDNWWTGSLWRSSASCWTPTVTGWRSPTMLQVSPPDKFASTVTDARRHKFDAFRNAIRTKSNKMFLWRLTRLKFSATLHQLATTPSLPP